MVTWVETYNYLALHNCVSGGSMKYPSSGSELGQTLLVESLELVIRNENLGHRHEPLCLIGVQTIKT